MTIFWEYSTIVLNLGGAGMNNTKRENFERLAEKRMTEAIKKIRLVANLSNKNNYDYTDSHVKEIVSTLENEILVLKKKFASENEDKEVNFKFKTRKE